MRPRWYFVLHGLFLLLGLIIIAGVLMYMVSFVVFMLHKSGVWFLPSFGFQGVQILFISLPWLLISATFLFLLLLEILVRHYSFGYRKPLLYSLCGVIVVVTMGSIVIAYTPLHEHFFIRAREGTLPFAGRFYRGDGFSTNEHFHFGEVTEINDDGFQIKNRRGELVNIVILPETRFPEGVGFQIGDHLVILGDRSSSTVTAFGVRRIEDQPMRLPTGHGWIRIAPAASIQR